jgi:hypothetical protein
MRTWEPTASNTIRDLLEQLRAEHTGPDAYRTAMTRLGQEFVRVHADRLAGIRQLMLICTSEDADSLARGVLDALATREGPAVRVACFWNARKRVSGARSGVQLDLAPIVRRYVEPGEPDAFLVVQSSLSSECVVRTNITELVHDLDPARVLIFAPVLHRGADERLRQEFDDAIARRFEFYCFAEDDGRDGKDLIPGLGGQVHERPGVGSRADGNRYTPQLVRQRRKLALPEDTLGPASPGS